jgi:hypothetical protein
MHRLGIVHEDVLMNMFRYYLEGNAREWCRSQPTASIASLKYFHATLYSYCKKNFSAEILYQECCEEFELLYCHPNNKDQCLRDQIRDPTVIHFSLETRVLLLEQFPAHSDGRFFRTIFPVGSGYHTSPESHIFVDLSVHASNPLSSSDHGYFDVICLYSSDDP